MYYLINIKNLSFQKVIKLKYDFDIIIRLMFIKIKLIILLKLFFNIFNKL